MASHEMSIEPQVSELPRLATWVEECCASDGLSTDFAFKMALVLEEAVSNVVNHAFPEQASQPITIRLEITGERFAAEVIDSGMAFDPTAAPDPNLSLPLEEREPGGLGIHLMRQMTDRLDYRRDRDRNILRLEKARR